MYLHEKDNWTEFTWDENRVAILLDEVVRQQGHLYGRLSGMGFNDQLRAMAENMTRELLFSSEIEGIKLNVDEVRSSIARRLGIDLAKYVASSRYVEAVVAIMVDATEHYDRPLTKEILCGWQSAFFPTGYSQGNPIEVGKYRSHDEVIVSGYMGRERVHYMAPSPERVEQEMHRFIDWFNAELPISPVIRSAIAHFWFVSIHPFEDGNGRLARIIGDMMLARGDKSKMRFYNLSSAINLDKKHYYVALESMQRGDGDITEWLVWYLHTLQHAIEDAQVMVSAVLNKSIFWMHAAKIAISQRQVDVLNLFLDGYEAKITSKNWASMGKCSKDTAIRDIQDLVNKGVLYPDVPDAKRPSYSINYGIAMEDFMQMFSQVQVIEDKEKHFLVANYQGHVVKERITSLDADRYLRGDITLPQLMSKYFSYLAAQRV
ncbi:MAG: Fic family protein [Muribaculaceae bacterium]|nr:Fic family protein [Muribaculaceae bacterium]